MKNLVYFGGGFAVLIKCIRICMCVMMIVILDKICSVDQVFVVGYKNLDMDVFGFVVGMQLFVSNVIENSYVIYDEE